MICWPGREPPRRSWEKKITEGHHCNVSSWELSSHTGTHIDAPLHFFDDGESIDRIPPEILIGECRVIESALGGEYTLSLEDVSPCRGVKRILVRSSHSRLEDERSYPHHPQLFTPDAARFLLEGGVRLIGTDRLSVDDSKGESYSLHHLFLESGCVLLEGVNLEMVEPGRYSLYALPLRLSGAEASPARAFLSTRSIDST